MISIKEAGTIGGETIREATIEDGDASLSILSYGCVTRDWRVPKPGRRIPVVLGFPDVETYPEHSRSFGIIAGRVANRTALGRFTLDGQTYQLPTNNGPNHLHGGIKGLGRRNWTLEADSAENTVLLTLSLIHI